MRRYAPQRMRRFFPDRVPASVLARITIWASGAYGIVQGLAILRADPARFAGPGYASTREFPWAMTSWGVSAIAFGVLTLLGSITQRYWLKTLGVFGLSLWLGLFAYGAWVAVLQSPLAGPTGPSIYFLGAFLCAVLMFHDESRKP